MAQPAAPVLLPGVLWHVTLTLHGQPARPEQLRESLSELAFHHGIGLSAVYSSDTVELRYWDEGSDCRTVVAAALELWDSHRQEQELPSWPVVGVEVLDRPSFRRRWPDGSGPGDPGPGVHPWPDGSGTTLGG